MTNVGKSEEQLPQKTVGRPTVDRLSADSWPTVSRLLTNSRPLKFQGTRYMQ